MAGLRVYMAGWFKAEFSTCRIALKAVIYKSQKPRIKGSIYIFCPIVVAQRNQKNYEIATATSGNSINEHINNL